MKSRTKKKKYKVVVVRLSASRHTFEVDADNPQKASEMAFEQASRVTFPKSDVRFTIDSLTEPSGREWGLKGEI